MQVKVLITGNQSKENVVEGLDNLIKGKLLSDKKISEKSLIPWKFAILTKVDKKFPKIKTRIKSSKSNLILKQTDLISSLEALQKNFALVPIGNASNNIAVICKRYYLEVILNEIGVI